MKDFLDTRSKFLSRVIEGALFTMPLCLLALSGCNTASGPAFSPGWSIGTTDTMVTSGDARVIFERIRDTKIYPSSVIAAPVSFVSYASSPAAPGGLVAITGPQNTFLGDASYTSDKSGNIIAKHKVVCAEPSPDAIKEVIESVSAVVSSVTAAQSAAAGATSNYANPITTLGKRTATIQMLRDMQYRDCEAYANGALDEVGYAIRMNRFDAFAATLLAMESAAELQAASGVSPASLVSTAGVIQQMQVNYLAADNQYAAAIVCYRVTSDHSYDGSGLQAICTNFLMKLFSRIAASGPLGPPNALQ